MRLAIMVGMQLDGMKRLLLLLGCSGGLLCAADLAEVRNVYVMPMARGFDQYLASQITSQGLFQVVTDPKLADAVFSDRVGETLQSQLERIFPTPEPEPEPKAAPPAKEEATDKAKKKADRPQSDDQNLAAAFAETAGKLEKVSANSSFGRSKGNIFLVEAKSRQVVWSTYDPPKTSAARDLDRTASAIVSRIKKDLTKKQK